MPETEIAYQSYLLRLWRENPSTGQWRAMLENVSEPGQRRYFKDLKSLATFILSWQEYDAQGDNKSKANL